MDGIVKSEISRKKKSFPLKHFLVTDEVYIFGNSMVSRFARLFFKFTQPLAKSLVIKQFGLYTAGAA